MNISSAVTQVIPWYSNLLKGSSRIQGGIEEESSRIQGGIRPMRDRYVLYSCTRSPAKTLQLHVEGLS